MNEIIANKKDINDEMFSNYLKYENPSSLAKDLIRVTQTKSEQLVNNVNDGLTDLRKAKFLEMKIETKQSILLKKYSNSINNKKVKELKYELLNKCFKDYQQPLHK